VKNLLKKFSLIGVIIFSTFSLASAQETTLKLGTLAPEGSPFDLIIRDMGEQWKAAGVKLQIYPGGVLGDEPDIVTKMRLGQIQVGVLTVVGLAKIDKASQALCIPMLYKDYAESDYVRKKMEPVLEARLLAKGFKVLNWGEAGWVSFFGKEPILTPEDLKKMKFFVWGDDTDTMNIWKSAGYSPIPLAATDILPNLQTGLINSFDTTPVSALSFQWFALAPHMTNFKWAPLLGANIITVKAWNKLAPAQQEAMKKASAAAGVQFKTEIRSGESKAIETMKKHGLVVHDITPEQYKQWQTVFEGVYPQISGTVIPKDMMDMAIKYRDEYRAKQSTKAAAE
jgi:TRAP-type C4-dicarboxylate transport system substrate-binding protein